MILNLVTLAKSYLAYKVKFRGPRNQDLDILGRHYPATHRGVL